MGKPGLLTGEGVTSRKTPLERARRNVHLSTVGHLRALRAELDELPPDSPIRKGMDVVLRKMIAAQISEAAHRPAGHVYRHGGEWMEKELGLGSDEPELGDEVPLTQAALSAWSDARDRFLCLDALAIDGGASNGDGREAA